MAEEEQNSDSRTPKLADRTEQFGKSKSATLWFSAALILISFSSEAATSPFGIKIEKFVLTALLVPTIFYYSLNFWLDWKIQWAYNKKLYQFVISRNLTDLHIKLKEEFLAAVHSVEKFSDLKKFFSEESFEKGASKYVADINKQIDLTDMKLKNRGLDLEFQINFFFDDLSNRCFAIFDSVSEFASFYQLNEAIEFVKRDIKTALDEEKSSLRDSLYEALEKLKDHLKVREEDGEYGFYGFLDGKLAGNFDEIKKIMSDISPQFEKIKDRLNDFEAFEESIAKSEKNRLLWLDLFAPMAFAVFALISGISVIIDNWPLLHR